MSNPNTHKEIEDVEITNSITLHILGIVGEVGSEERMDNVEKAVDNIEAIIGQQITSTQSQVLDRAIDDLRECRKQASPGWHKGLDTAIQRLKQIKTDD